MVDYTRMRALASRLIQKNGRTIALRKVSRAAPEDPTPNQPWDPEGDASATPNTDKAPPRQDITVKGVVVPITRARIDDTLVRVNDMEAYISSADVGDVEITTRDKIVDKGRVFNIVEVTDISPGDLKVLYVLQLRA